MVLVRTTKVGVLFKMLVYVHFPPKMHENEDILGQRSLASPDPQLEILNYKRGFKERTDQRAEQTTSGAFFNMAKSQ